MPVPAPPHDAGADLPSLAIGVVAGTGAGPPPLAAFDECLRIAGVSNYNNLVRLSSVIPPGVAARWWVVDAGSSRCGDSNTRWSSGRAVRANRSARW